METLSPEIGAVLVVLAIVVIGGLWACIIAGERADAIEREDQNE